MSMHQEFRSAVRTRHNDQASAQQPDYDAGVVGLPSAGTLALPEETIDLNAVDTSSKWLEDFLNEDAFDTTYLTGLDNLEDDQRIDKFQTTDLPQSILSQDFHQNSLGIGLESSGSVGQEPWNTIIPSDNYPLTYDHNPSNLGQFGSKFDNNSINSYHDFELWGNSYSAPTQLLQTTPGFSAIPGDGLMSDLHGTIGQSSIYPDPLTAVHSNGPYYTPPNAGYFGYDEPDQSLQYPLIFEPQQNIKTRDVDLKIAQNLNLEDFKPPNHSKRKYDPLDTDSDDDKYLVKRRRHVQHTESRRTPQRSDIRRSSTVSNCSSLSKPVKVSTVQSGEKPQKCEDKSWVRINNSTKGETTRTARINQFSAKGTRYKVKPLPVGDWETSQFRFEYSHHNGMDEFKKHTMSAEQIHQYITEYPGEYLCIWIQVTPGDSARRYASKSHSECLFEQCPNRRWANKGTIEVGNYRVAFDEKHKKYGKGVVDPFDCVAYAHLYCMERFLDFESICQHADVKVDTRGEMTKEPKGEARFIFAGKHATERTLAEKFVKAAKVGQLRRTPEFSSYPIHTNYARAEAKPHEDTLVYAMYNINWESRTRSQRKQFLYRDIKPGSFGIHRGDQEIIMANKKVETLKAFKKAKQEKKHKDFDYSAYYDRFHPEINIRIKECLALRAKFQSEDAAGTAPSRTNSRKRNNTVFNDSEDEDDDFMNKGNINEWIKDEFKQQEQLHLASSTRSSPRKKRRINYNEVEAEDVPQLQKTFNQISQEGDILRISTAQHQSHDVAFGQINSDQVLLSSSLSPKLHKASCTELFPETHFDLDNQTLEADDFRPITDEELEQLLNRRKSSTMSIGPYTGIMKSPKLSQNSTSTGRVLSGTRNACFNSQPVTSSIEYNVDDPPKNITVSQHAVSLMQEHSLHTRRSARIASRKQPLVDGI